MSKAFRRTSSLWAASALLAVLAVTACNYTFRGGGGLPDNIRTIYVDALENETTQLDLDILIFTQLQQEIPSSLGLQLAGRDAAHALLRGRIVRYEDVAQNYRPDTGSAIGVDVLQREVTVVMAVELIDVGRNLIIWDGSAVTGKGTYRPDEGQTEQSARLEAIKLLVQQIRDGAQSQW